MGRRRGHGARRGDDGAEPRVEGVGSAYRVARAGAGTLAITVVRAEA